MVGISATSVWWFGLLLVVRFAVLGLRNCWLGFWVGVAGLNVLVSEVCCWVLRGVALSRGYLYDWLH